MSATISNEDEQMSQAPERAVPQESDSAATAAPGNVSAELDRLQEEVAKARKAEEEAFRQLDTVKARNYDLESQRVEIDAEMAEAKAEIDQANGELKQARADTMQVEGQLAEVRDAAAARSAELEKTRMDLESQREQNTALISRYQDRLADIAELGHAIARSEGKLSRLQAQHEYAVLRHHVMQKLAPGLAQLHKGLAKQRLSKARRRADDRVAADSALIAASGLFDAEWYLEFYPDVAQGDLDALKHYVLYGAYEVRDPGPAFSAFKYHKANPDVTDAGIPALLHYLRNGKDEDRRAFKVGEGA